MSQTITYSKTNKAYTYGHAQAVIVLVGKSLGMQTSTEDIAADLLNNKPVHAILSARASKEATEIHNQIANSEDMVRKANEIAQELKVQYGFLRPN